MFINGVLYANTEVTTAIFKKIPSPEFMPYSFKVLLAHRIAKHYTLAPGSDLDRRSEVKRECDIAHVRAARTDTKAPADPQLLDVYYFVKTVRTESALRY